MTPVNHQISGADGKAQVFSHDRLVRIHLFAKLFFLPFKISYRIGKAFIFNKNEGLSYYCILFYYNLLQYRGANNCHYLQLV